MYYETTARQHIDDNDKLCEFMLREVGLEDNIQIRGRATGALEYEVELHHEKSNTIYYFGTYEEAQKRAKELYPDVDWETTGW